MRMWVGVKFLLIVVVCYAIGIAAWPVTDKGYLAIWHTTMETLYGSIAGCDLVYRDVKPPDPDADTERYFTKGDYFAQKKTNVRFRGYLPMVIFIAIVLATPVRWARKWRALLWGAFVMTGVLALGEGFTVVHFLSQNHAMHSIDLPAPIAFVVQRGAVMFSQSTSTMFVVPVVVWVALTVRKSDLERLRQRPDEHASKASA